MLLKRHFITPFLTFIFAAVAASGVMMFFHITDGFTEVLHETMGLVFVAFVALHVVINWKSIRNYFGKKYFILAPIIVLILSVGLIALERTELPIDIIVAERIIKAPLTESFAFLKIDHKRAAVILRDHGMTLEGAKTIEEIWINNQSSPKEVLHILFYKSRND